MPGGRQLEYIELDVLVNNSGAIRFYERYGFSDKRRSMICWLQIVEKYAGGQETTRCPGRMQAVRF